MLLLVHVSYMYFYMFVYRLFSCVMFHVYVNVTLISVSAVIGLDILMSINTVCMVLLKVFLEVCIGSLNK